MNIKDSFRNKHCRISLNDVGGKLVQTLDSGVGWGWGWRNLHWNGDRDGEFFVGMGKILFTVSLSSREANFFISICQHYEQTAGPICMKFSGKVWSDHGMT